MKSSTYSGVVPGPPAQWRGAMNGAPKRPFGEVVPSPDSDVLLKLAFGVFVLDLFLVESRALEIISMTGVGRIPYVGVTIHVVLLALVMISGGASRVVTSRVGIYLGLFTLWMLLSTLASDWRGGSVDTLLRQWLPSLIIFIGCGTVVTLAQCRKVWAIPVVGTALIAGSSFALATLKQDRLSFESGTLSNANELSMLLVTGAPFCLMPLFSKNSSSVRKLVALALGAMVLVVVIRSASRGNFLALASILAVLFWTRPLVGKIKLLAVTAVLILVFFAATPREVLSRYGTIFGDAETGDEIADSARQSSLRRQHLLEQSLKLTMEHPILGMGPGIFMVGRRPWRSPKAWPRRGTFPTIPTRRCPRKWASPVFLSI